MKKNKFFFCCCRYDFMIRENPQEVWVPGKKECEANTVSDLIERIINHIH